MPPNLIHCVFGRDVHVKAHGCLDVRVSHELLQETGRDDLCPPSAESPPDVVGARILLRTVFLIDFDFCRLADVHKPV